jgi:hypothetical protein
MLASCTRALDMPPTTSSTTSDPFVSFTNFPDYPEHDSPSVYLARIGALD